MMRLPVIAVMALGAAAFAEPRLPGLIGDHMVLQQGRPAAIWGTAAPGEPIEVTLESATPPQRTVTGADGRWKVLLPSMRAGGPFTLTVRGSKTLLVHDVLIGEVWVLSGQSNMTYELSRASNGDAAVAHADHPDIRLFTVPKKSVVEPVDDIASSWQICTPETAKSFSAVGYFFGEELHRRLGVPVGLIHSSWPGSSAEQWTPREKMQGDPELQPILQRWQEAPEDVRQLARAPVPFDLEFGEFELLRADDGHDAVPLMKLDGGVCRTVLGGVCDFEAADGAPVSFELTPDGHARMSGGLDPAYSSVLRVPYRAGNAPADLSMYTGIRFRYRGSGQFHLQSLQPTITDFDNYGTATFRVTSEWQTATIVFADLKQAGWGVKLPFTPFRLNGFLIEALTTPGFAMMPPAGLYNGMLAPLTQYAVRGASWYQGESNAGRSYQYRRLLPALIQSWRDAWKQPALPFLIAQLPNLGAGKAEPSESGWAELREAQLLTIKSVSNTGLAVTIDVGEPDNLHPPDKVDVGRRLALWALGTVYGEHVCYSGPLYESMTVEGSSARILFSHAGSGLAARDAGGLRGFAVAGVDRRFHWADATIDGDSVVVHSPDVPAPAAVRYAWADDPDCNLINREGLPASPFRTDDWPGITASSR